MSRPNTHPSPEEPRGAPRSPSRRRFLTYAGGIVVAASGIDLVTQRHEADRLVVEETDIAIPGWPAAPRPYRIGQLSDFHCDFPKALARTHLAVQMMLAQKPDVVFLTGDYVSGVHSRHWIDPCAEALAPLAAVPGGVYGVLGNHDWWCGGRHWIARKLENAGVRMLLNASAPFPGAPGCHIVGVDDPLSGAARPELARRGLPRDDIKILLAHEPDYADQFGLGFALQLSGHSHGGQIRLPFLPPIHTPAMGRRYPEGLQQAEHHPVYTSRGVGTIGPPIRLHCPPEVTILNVTPGPAFV